MGFEALVVRTARPPAAPWSVRGKKDLEDSAETGHD
jgi:hypothetical protein